MGPRSRRESEPDRLSLDLTPSRSSSNGGDSRQRVDGDRVEVSGEVDDETPIDAG